MPSMRASGHAAMPRRAANGGIIRIPIGTRMANRLWPVGTTPGWRNCPAAAPAGLLPCACAGCGRVRPGENLNLVAAEQIRSWLDQQRRQTPLASGPTTGRPIFTCDAGYDSVQLSLALADQPIGLLVRLRAGRCFYAEPTTQPKTGRPRRHGAKFICDDPTSWPAPTAQWSSDDAGYGRVQLHAWSGLHALPQQHAGRGTRGPRPLVRGVLIRLQVDRLPRPTKPPAPLWFWWSAPMPPDLAMLWQAYLARFSIEQTFRFFKQTLKWTTPKLRAPGAASPRPLHHAVPLVAPAPQETTIAQEEVVSYFPHERLVRILYFHLNPGITWCGTEEVVTPVI
jgi:hypothetical protein